jgi:hypothetical protein
MKILVVEHEDPAREALHDEISRLVFVDCCEVRRV